MSYLNLKEDDELNRKPLEHLRNQISTTSSPGYPPVYPWHHPADEATRRRVYYEQPAAAMYSPPRLPEVVNRPRLYTDFNGGSDLYQYDNGAFEQQHDMNFQSYHPSGEYDPYYQDRKRYKVDNSASVHAPDYTLHPSMHHQAPCPPPNEYRGGFQRLLDVSNSIPPTILEESSRDETNLVVPRDGHPKSLWLPEDQQHLTELHCFVRKHCVFIFSASAYDVETPRKGRKKALTLGQIGIGCLHCRYAETKLKGSTYFPTSISGIYNATMIIQQRHFPVCPDVMKETFCQYQRLKSLTARSASTKQYWVSAATQVGLVDTPNGVFFRSHYDPTIGPPLAAIPQVIQPSGPLVSLVEPRDKMFATEYAYFVMCQMTTCVFTEADRLGKRKCHKVGFAGLACRHCYGGNGSGRFFPLTIKTFSDVSKSIHVLKNHLVKCTKAPRGMAETVNMLYKRHKEEKETTPFGSQKIFFDNVWKRLHPEQIVNEPKKKKKGKGARLSNKRKSTTDNAALPDVNMTRRDEPQVYENSCYVAESSTASVDHTSLPPLPASPPVIHRGQTDSQLEVKRHNKDLCMIPKKRYIMEHSESDLSVAMILANGFERIVPQAVSNSPEDKVASSKVEV